MFKVHLFISGRVQGVFFRKFVYDQAMAKRITGWVRNLYDGRVEVIAFHENKNLLEEFVKKCQRGPPMASVTKIEQNWEEIDAKDVPYSTFTIESTA